MAATQIITPSREVGPRPTIPFPQPATAPEKPVVTQEELSWLLDARGELTRLQEQVKAAESSILSRLESGVMVEPGARFAGLKEHLRRSVPWREVSERLAERLYGEDKGAAYCENVLQNTKPTRSVSLEVR